MATQITVTVGTGSASYTVSTGARGPAGASGSSGLTVGTTTITSGTTTRILYNSAGVVGEYSISGTGGVAMTNSPTFVTPVLGVATATTINGVAIAASQGGNGAADSGKLLAFDPDGYITAKSIGIGDTVTGIIGSFNGYTLVMIDAGLTYNFTLSTGTQTSSRSIAFPDADGTVALTANKLSAFAATTSAELAGVISDETGTGALVLGTGPTLTSPVIANIAPAADFTLTQNSVPVINSIAMSAVTNTVRINTGLVRVGPGAITTAALYPFEVMTVGDAAVSSTAGAIYVDTAGAVRVGNLSATGGGTRGRLVVQDRIGGTIVDLNASTSVHSMSGTFNNAAINNFTASTDSTSSTTGAVKLSGGMGVVKSIYGGAAIVAATYLKAGSTVVGSLPAAATAGVGAMMVATDALGPVAGVAVAAGGSADCLVVSNGTNWIVSTVL